MSGVNSELMEEFERLEKVIYGHPVTCECSDCKRFIEIGDLIREQRGVPDSE